MLSFACWYQKWRWWKTVMSLSTVLITPAHAIGNQVVTSTSTVAAKEYKSRIVMSVEAAFSESGSVCRLIWTVVRQDLRQLHTPYAAPRRASPGGSTSFDWSVGNCCELIPDHGRASFCWRCHSPHSELACSAAGTPEHRAGVCRFAKGTAERIRKHQTVGISTENASSQTPCGGVGLGSWFGADNREEPQFSIRQGRSDEYRRDRLQRYSLVRRQADRH